MKYQLSLYTGVLLNTKWIIPFGGGSNLVILTVAQHNSLLPCTEECNMLFSILIFRRKRAFDISFFVQKLEEEEHIDVKS